MNYIFYYIATVLPLVLLDSVWILFIAKSFYSREMGFLFSKSINFTPVIFFYLIYALVVLLLIVLPGLQGGSGTSVLFRGALLGLAAYGAYDLTNHATISNWPTIMTIVDMSWGVFVTAVASLCAYLIITFFK